MKAAVYRRFGPPEAVRIEEAATPLPGRSEVLIHVHASTVSAADHRARGRDVPRGLGVLAAPVLGIFRPRRRVLGMDVAGVVESVGADVTKFQPGDAVIAMLGASFGGHAEYTCVPEDGAITAKPHNMTFEDAVTLVFGGLTARVFLSRAGIKPGGRVLVNGASGAVGTAAVQLAKQLGAHVTGVSSGAHAELVASLGADRVLDYAAVDVTTEGRTYDVVMDCVGNLPFERAAALINPGGALLLVVADLEAIPLAPWRSRASGKLVTAGSVTYTAEDLAFLVRLAEQGHYRSVRDRSYDLADVVAAHRFVDAGRKWGNVALRMPASTAARMS